jgi:hypothetical protein
MSKIETEISDTCGENKRQRRDGNFMDEKSDEISDERTRGDEIPRERSQMSSQWDLLTIEGLTMELRTIWRCLRDYRMTQNRFRRG